MGKSIKMNHILSDSQFTKQNILYIHDLTNKIRDISKSKKGVLFLKTLLPHKRAILYFTQTSTRTFLSFQSACQVLGMSVLEIRNPSVSSEVKGEKIQDAIRTFSSYCDLIIMRSLIPGLCQESALMLSNTPRPVPIINAGSGSDEHPTQAVLDVYTFIRWFNKQNTSIENKTFCLIGDLRRGRTVRSLVRLLCLFKKIKLILISPKEYSIKSDLREYLKANEAEFVETTDMKNYIKDADALYITRIQDEYGDVEKEVNITDFCFNKDHLDLIKKTCAIAHPFPRRQELSSDIDSDPRAVYWRQERNGMWVRVSLIATLFDIDQYIMSNSAQL